MPTVPTPLLLLVLPAAAAPALLLPAAEVPALLLLAAEAPALLLPAADAPALLLPSLAAPTPKSWPKPPRVVVVSVGSIGTPSALVAIAGAGKPPSSSPRMRKTQAEINARKKAADGCLRVISSRESYE